RGDPGTSVAGPAAAFVVAGALQDEPGLVEAELRHAERVGGDGASLAELQDPLRDGTVPGAGLERDDAGGGDQEAAHGAGGPEQGEEDQQRARGPLHGARSGAGCGAAVGAAAGAGRRPLAPSSSITSASPPRR